MKSGWIALVVGVFVLISTIGCTKQVLPPDAQTIKLAVPNLMSG